MRRSPLALLFLTVTLDLIGFGMVVPLMPLYAEQFAVSGRAIAWLLSSYSLMQFFFAPVWGRLSDRIGRRPVLIASIFVNALCLLGFAASRTYVQLLIARLGAGVCTANISVASAYVADVTGPKGRARGMGAIGAAFGLGFVLGPFFAGELSGFGLATPALCAAGLSLANGLLALWLLPESLPKSARAPRAPRTGWLTERLASLRLQPSSWSLYALVFLQVCGFAMMEMALALFCEHDFAMTAAASGRLMAFVGAVMVLVQGGAIGPLARRFGEPTLVMGGLLCLAASLMALPMTSGWGAASPLYVCMAVLAGAQGCVTPALSVLISRAAPATAQGGAMGLAQSSSALARTIGPALAGVLLDAFGSVGPFFGGGATVLLACCLALATHGTSRSAVRAPALAAVQRHGAGAVGSRP